MFGIRSFFAALRAPGASGRRGGGDVAGPFERGTAALERGAHAAALAEFEAAVAAAGDPQERAAAQNKRGVVLVALGRRDDALAAFAAALGCAERSAPPLANIANLLLEDGDLLDAVDYYEAALRADERYFLALRNLGVALKRLGRRGEAVKAFRSAARLEARSRPGRA